MKFRHITRLLLLMLIVAVVLTTSVIPLDNPTAQARRYTQPYEFDYFAWIMDAFGEKTGQWRMDVIQRLPPESQRQAVLRYFDLVRQLEQTQGQINVIFSDPNVTDPESAAANLLSNQKNLESALNTLAPITESILQYQASEVLQDLDIGFLRQTLPPVLFHSTPLPKALIVSPRDSIQQEVNISLLSDMSLEDIVTLENNVERSMNASALVVDVGGIGVYPTMVERSSDMRWTINTIVHEWTHNYLSLTPLGINYDTTPELRTMNETTASIVGTEVSEQIMKRFYPDLAAEEENTTKTTRAAPALQTFDFQHEMHVTRVTVDELLAQGKIEEAEQYMAQRRIVFVQHGYMIRKLNQAYFAFNGAYAEEPVGAAGEDPVGPAVRALRAQSATVGEFLRRISQMNSFAKLQEAVK